MIYYNKMRHEIGREKETGRFMGDMERGIEEGCFLPRVEDEGQRYGRNKDTAINHILTVVVTEENLILFPIRLI